MDDRASTRTTMRLGGQAHEAELVCPASPSGVVLFAHGSGSSRHSPRNRQVAASLQARGLATLLFDLLHPQEAADPRKVFDIALLGARMMQAIAWVETQDALRGLPIGLFGASTGAAAALAAAASRPAQVHAVVSRGGRPDLAAGALTDVLAPTLLIVGGADPVVLDLNRQALVRLGGPCKLAIVPGATHLFEEPGALDQVIRLAGDWFTAHLAHVESSRIGTQGGGD